MYNLNRFVQAQDENGCSSYADALQQMKKGRKTGHWIWYIFPQIAGLTGSHGSYDSDYYAIRSLEEAKAYMADETLGRRLLEITETVLSQPEENVYKLMGSPIDVKKLRSSMTLFAAAAPEQDVFQKVLDRYFEGQPDPKTLAILEK